MDRSLSLLDAIAQAELVRRAEVSARELLDACHARLEALNPILRAVVTIARPTSNAGASKPSGALAGVPFVVKDSLPWPGLRWSMGARALASNVAQEHTPYGKRLVEAGLVCVGKSALSELGLRHGTETSSRE